MAKAKSFGEANTTLGGYILQSIKLFQGHLHFIIVCINWTAAQVY